MTFFFSLIFLFLLKTIFSHLCNIAHLRSSLTLADAETLIHALITSCLDYCNTLFRDLPKKLIAILQYVQNFAAIVLTSTRRSAHINFTSYLWHHVSTLRYCFYRSKH